MVRKYIEKARNDTVSVRIWIRFKRKDCSPDTPIYFRNCHSQSHSYSRSRWYFLAFLAHVHPAPQALAHIQNHQRFRRGLSGMTVTLLVFRAEMYDNTCDRISLGVHGMRWM